MKSNVIGRTMITSMSAPWSKIKENMHSAIVVTAEHLVKVYYYHDYPQYFNQWFGSISAGFFNKMPNIVKINKRPTPEQIKKALWDECLNNPSPNNAKERERTLSVIHENVIRNVFGKYDEVPKLMNEDYLGFKKFAEAFIDFLSEKVSINGILTKHDVKEFVDSWDDWPSGHLVGQSINRWLLSSRRKISIPWRDIVENFLFCHLFSNIQYLWKIYYFRNVDDGAFIDCWCRGASRGWENIPRCFETGKYPTWNKVFDAIWNIRLDGDIECYHDGLVEDWIYDKGRLPDIIETDYFGFRKFVMCFFKYSAHYVERKGCLTAANVRTFVDSWDDWPSDDSIGYRD